MVTETETVKVEMVLVTDVTHEMKLTTLTMEQTTVLEKPVIHLNYTIVNKVTTRMVLSLPMEKEDQRTNGKDEGKVQGKSQEKVEKDITKVMIVIITNAMNMSKVHSLILNLTDQRQ